MINSLLTFIETHQQWAFFVIFMIAFLESIAIVGLLIPGWALLIGIGGLIGAEVLDFRMVVIAAYLGAVIGEYLSFMLGRYYHDSILSWPIVKRHESIVATSKNFFANYGTSGVFLGRFFGPTRAVVPLIAGISEMPRRSFIWVNLISGLLWAPLYLIPGILVGAAVSINDEARNFILLYLGVMLIFGVAAWQYIRKLIAQSKQNKPSFVLLLKGALSIAIMVVATIILYASDYWPLVSKTLSIVGDRLLS